jgi:hypothetical protein
MAGRFPAPSGLCSRSEGRRGLQPSVWSGVPRLSAATRSQAADGPWPINAPSPNAEPHASLSFLSEAPIEMISVTGLLVHHSKERGHLLARDSHCFAHGKPTRQ